MAGLTPLPPTISHSSQRLTHAQAQSQLATFLSLAENDAAYRPDSTLTERGPQSASTGANPNLTLHHLQRILKGIEGKRIGGADIGRFFGDGAVAARVAGLPRDEQRQHDNNKSANKSSSSSASKGLPARAKRNQFENQHPEDEPNAFGVATEEQDDWQEKEDYEMAQREGGMELLDDDRQPGLTLPQPDNEDEAEEMVGVNIEDTGSRVLPSKKIATKDGTKDKDARKAAKKAKKLKELKDRKGAVRGKTS